MQQSDRDARRNPRRTWTDSNIGVMLGTCTGAEFFRAAAMKRKISSSLLASAVLLCVLMAAEALVVAHAVDLDAHANGEPCKICISFAGFGAAAPAKAPPLDLPSADEPTAAPQAAGPDLAPIEREPVRGPPRRS